VKKRTNKIAAKHAWDLLLDSQRKPYTCHVVVNVYFINKILRL